MTPLKQKYRHNPENNVYGDCHRAAIASLLDLSLEAVPHFYDGNLREPEESQVLEREFLASRGLYPIQVSYITDDLYGLLKILAANNPHLYYLLGGRSGTGCNHTVVCCHDKIVHDPSLDNAGIVGPCRPSGAYEITYFGSIVLCSVEHKTSLVSA